MTRPHVRRTDHEIITGHRAYVQILERTNPTTLTVSNPGLVLWGK